MQAAADATKSGMVREGTNNYVIYLHIIYTACKLCTHQLTSAYCSGLCGWPGHRHRREDLYRGRGQGNRYIRPYI